MAHRLVSGIRSFVSLAGLAGLLTIVAPAAAHEYWLAPSLYRASPGDTIALTAFAGTGFRGEPKRYATTRAVRFVLRGARTRDLSEAAVNGELTWASFEAQDGGGALVAYQSNFAKIELPAVEFDAYLDLEGLSAPRTARARLGMSAGPGRERYARCAKTWIAGTQPAAAAKGIASRLMKPVGTPIEIVPLADPGEASVLPVRVLWRGKPLAGALVRAWNTPLAGGAASSGLAPTDAAVRDSVGFTAHAITDAKGEVLLPIAAPGEWLIGAVNMVPCSERAEADWESWWASFTFARVTR